MRSETKLGLLFLLFFTLTVLTAIGVYPQVLDQTLGYRAAVVTQLVEVRQVSFFFQLLLLLSILPRMGRV